MIQNKPEVKPDQNCICYSFDYTEIILQMKVFFIKFNQLIVSLDTNRKKDNMMQIYIFCINVSGIVQTETGIKTQNKEYYETQF